MTLRVTWAGGPPRTLIDWAARQYRNGHGTRALALATGFSDPTVAEWLKRAGVEMRHRGTKPKPTAPLEAIEVDRLALDERRIRAQDYRAVLTLRQEDDGETWIIVTEVTPTGAFDRAYRPDQWRHALGRLAVGAGLDDAAHALLVRLAPGDSDTQEEGTDE